MSRKVDTILDWTMEAADRAFIRTVIELGFDPDSQEEVPPRALEYWRASIWSKHRGCLCRMKTKREVAGLVEEFVRTDGLSTAESVKELIDKARLAPLPIPEFDPVQYYRQRRSIEDQEQSSRDGEEMLEVGSLTEVELTLYDDSCCGHLVAQPREPHTPVTAVEDSWEDEWGDDPDEFALHEQLHHLHLHC